MVLLHELGLQVQILVDGVPAREYRCEHKEDVGDGIGIGDGGPIQRHRYIESITGAKFAIHLAILNERPSESWCGNDDDDYIVAYVIAIDGKYAGKGCISCNDDATVNGVCDGDTVQPFQFVTIDPAPDTAEDLVAEHQGQVDQFGTIKVRTWCVVRSKEREPSRVTFPIPTNFSSGDGGLKVSAEALRLTTHPSAPTHGTRLGQAIAFQPNTAGRPLGKWYWISTNNAYLTFVYRSKDAFSVPSSKSYQCLPFDAYNQAETQLQILKSSQAHQRGAHVSNEPDRLVPPELDEMSLAEIGRLSWETCANSMARNRGVTIRNDLDRTIVDHIFRETLQPSCESLFDRNRAPVDVRERAWIRETLAQGVVYFEADQHLTCVLNGIDWNPSTAPKWLHPDAPAREANGNFFMTMPVGDDRRHNRDGYRMNNRNATAWSALMAPIWEDLP